MPDIVLVLYGMSALYIALKRTRRLAIRWVEPAEAFLNALRWLGTSSGLTSKDSAISARLSQAARGSLRGCFIIRFMSPAA